MIKDREGNLARFILERATEQTPFVRRRNVYEMNMRVKVPKEKKTKTARKKKATISQEPVEMDLDCLQRICAALGVDAEDAGFQGQGQAP